MEQDQSKGEGGRSRSYIEKRYGFKGALAESKLKQYIPILILTNLSSLLLVTVDGIVAGYRSTDASVLERYFIVPVAGTGARRYLRDPEIQAFHHDGHDIRVTGMPDHTGTDDVCHSRFLPSVTRYGNDGA